MISNAPKSLAPLSFSELISNHCLAFANVYAFCFTQPSTNRNHVFQCNYHQKITNLPYFQLN